MRGKNVLITGGARGIGFGIAKAVAQMGGNIVCLDSLPEPVEEFKELPQRFGVKTHYFRTDVTKESSLYKSFKDAVDTVGDLHGCLTAAGVALDKPFQEHTWEESRRILEVNCIGTFFSVQLAAKQMEKQGTGGSIVTIASIAAQGNTCPGQRLSIYNMSKGAVKAFVGPLAVELAPQKIRVNSISPGITRTPMTAALAIQYPNLVKMFDRVPPLGRMGSPEDIANAAVFLLSDASPYVTGADWLVDGGLHAGTSRSLKDPSEQ
ncbi:NAD(P)-binding protein [Viridothelium virens]|uniref:NAD(P)-binding protein n=1 Tax=Viridothelium virens TaxID=1048519 RepID=A0A6A6H6N6_VIRVR|nr:NAD(P)-binding protein [Viridothelium virens]